MHPRVCMSTFTTGKKFSEEKCRVEHSKVDKKHHSLSTNFYKIRLARDMLTY